MNIIKKLTDDEKDWFFTFWHDWQFFNCNWYDFSIIELKGEWDKMMGGIEFEAALMGLHMRFRWNYTVTEKAAEIRDQVAEIQAGRAETIPWDVVKERMKWNTHLDAAPKDGTELIFWVSSEKGFPDQTANFFFLPDTEINRKAYGDKVDCWYWVESEEPLKRPDLVKGWRIYPQPPIEKSSE